MEETEIDQMQNLTLDKVFHILLQHSVSVVRSHVIHYRNNPFNGSWCNLLGV